MCVLGGGGGDSGGVSDAYLLIQFPPTEGQSDDSVVRQLLSCYLQKKKGRKKKITALAATEILHTNISWESVNNSSRRQRRWLTRHSE